MSETIKFQPLVHAPKGFKGVWLDGMGVQMLYIREPGKKSQQIHAPVYTNDAKGKSDARAFFKYRAEALRRVAEDAKIKGECADEWYERSFKYQKELGHTDAVKKRLRWVKWISPHIGKKSMLGVTRLDVENIRNKLDAAIAAWEPGKAGKRGTCLRGKTAMSVWSCLTSSFKEACNSKRKDLQVLDGKPNPCAGVRPPGDRNSIKPRKKRFIYPREASLLLACTDVPLEWRIVYAIALYTYLRPGELYVLQWSDVDLAARTIGITKAWDYADGQIKPPKTECGIRDVPIDRNLLPMLTRLKKGREPSGLVVPCFSEFGEDHLAQLFRKHLKLAGVDRTELHASTRTHVQANFRSCRDSGITWLAMSGLDITRIKTRAGHDKIGTTMGYVKQAEDLSGTLGTPFGALPGNLVKRDVRVMYDHETESDHSVRVPEEGVECETISDTSEQHSVVTESSCDADQRDPTPPNTGLDGVLRASVTSIEAALVASLERASLAGQWDLVRELAGVLKSRKA